MRTSTPCSLPAFGRLHLGRPTPFGALAASGMSATLPTPPEWGGSSKRAIASSRVRCWTLHATTSKNCYSPNAKVRPFGSANPASGGFKMPTVRSRCGSCSRLWTPFSSASAPRRSRRLAVRQVVRAVRAKWRPSRSGAREPRVGRCAAVGGRGAGSRPAARSGAAGGACGAAGRASPIAQRSVRVPWGRAARRDAPGDLLAGVGPLLYCHVID